jgi:mannose-6-phosphate isomerase-like protein (cupin superfamily)
MAPGASLAETVPAGSDYYLFITKGGAALTVGSETTPLGLKASAVLQEGSAFTLTNTADSDTEVVKVVAPPAGAASAFEGFHGAPFVKEYAALEVVEVPEQHKTRRYIVGHGAAHSDRGHAMIVGYVKDTFTALHHHPNAESMFVLLNGNIRFTVDGEQRVVGPGQATVFKAGDIHSLNCADGTTEASFLEFHIPAKFTTVKE